MPSWSPNGREIVFASNRARLKSSIDQVYVMKADGSGIRQLTHGALDAREPSFSPNGKRIVYAANVLDSAGGNTGASAIKLVSAKGTNPRLLTPGLDDADLPSWSPDGRWIAFVVAERDLYIVRPDGSDLRRLAVAIKRTTFYGSALSWSPDSMEIAFGAGQVYRVRVNARRPIRVAGNGDVGPVTTDIAWSPDGSRIAYVRGTALISGGILHVERRHLWILDLKNHRRQLLRPVIDTSCVLDSGLTITWLRGPPLRLAVFAGKRTDLLSADGRKLGSLRPPNRGFLAVGSASPRGQKLLFVDSPSDCGAIYFGDPSVAAIYSAIYVAQLESGRVRQLTRG